ncbi:TPA: hypothetical protein JDJ25_003945 [Salmonella enterica subsp. salamae]|nr:hypothetical protein [Salmonella enterica subsp. salamae]
MAFTLDDLINDNRLGRLFSADERNCALQLWVLQITSNSMTQNRILYGRLLPYNHSNNSWSFSDNNKFQSLGQFKVNVTRLNLYIKNNSCAELLKKINDGLTISVISEALGFKFPDKLNKRFGETKLSTEALAYRPVSYLLNRDAYDFHTLSSPHGGAGALSASIIQTDKAALFRLGPDYDTALMDIVVKDLNEDTGLDFGRTDIARFGEIELLVFPALDDKERKLLDVSWVNRPRALVVRFNSMQVPQFTAFQFRLNIMNNGQVIFSGIAVGIRDSEGIFECSFELSDQIRTITDSTEIEIFGFVDECYRLGMLCCRWRIGYIREINILGHAIGQKSNPVKFDWLEKTIKPSMSDRAKSALTINRGNLGFTSHVGGREIDVWVPANKELLSIFEQLHPKKSEGMFFLRWGQSDGEGRLQFVEWFRKVLSQYQEHQIVIFDPYFEDAGLGLVLLCAASNSDYIIFTSLPKIPKFDETVVEVESDKLFTGRVNNLVACCENNINLLSKLKLRIYGMKEGRLHDRYILIMGRNGLPVTGFNLSNSFQKAAENHPLLITPIPSDVLLQVEEYMSSLLQEIGTNKNDDIEGSTAIRLLFDSKSLVMSPKRYEPLRFLEKKDAGRALSLWFNQIILRDLSGDKLKEQLVALDLLKGDSHILGEAGSIRYYLDNLAVDLSGFISSWDVIGDLLAHSHNDEINIQNEHNFIELLTQYLRLSFNRSHDDTNKELAVVDSQLFQRTLKSLLQTSYRVEHLFHSTKYTVLTWAEYYAVCLLWRYAPKQLLLLAEEQITKMPKDTQGIEIVRISLLSQIVSQISLSMNFNLSEVQQECLLRSGNGLLQWMGISAIESKLEKVKCVSTVLPLLNIFSHTERVMILGWMVNHAARNKHETQPYKDLIKALHTVLPEIISSDELQHLVDSLRGHMQRLAWAEPWLFTDVVAPLLQAGRVANDDACKIWTEELVYMLEAHSPKLFEESREGQTTNIAAFLLANSNPEAQSTSVKLIHNILKRQQRIVQQPLASTSNWTRWDGALLISMWILIFARWGKYYLRQRSMVNAELEHLSQEAYRLVVFRPEDEWRSKNTGKEGALMAVLDQVELLLTEQDGAEVSPQ